MLAVTKRKRSMSWVRRIRVWGRRYE